MKQYTHLFLDLDDTVMDFKKGQENAFFQACGEIGISVNHEDYLRYDEINKMSWKLYENGEIEKQRMMIRRYELFLEPFGKQDKAQVLNESYALFLSKQGIYLQGAEEGIKRLKKKYHISITTNGTSFIQRGRMAVCGLDKIVDSVFISDEIGYRKPYIEYYSYCLQKVGCEKEKVLVIGDSVTSDITGAVRSGLDCVLFNSGNKDCDLPVLGTVYSWEELLTFLGEKS